MAASSSFQLRIMHRLKHWIVDFLSFETKYRMHKLESRKCSKSGWNDCHQECFMADSCLLPLLAFRICLWQRTSKLWFFMDCFGDQKAIKTPKLNTIWLELITRVLNMPIELKDLNYYSKVFKRINYKLSNSTFWVVIMNRLGLWMISMILHH